MSYLSLREVSKHYFGPNGTLEALQGVSLDVERGEFVALLGPSGCGKSTLLRIVAGLEAPTGGIVTCAGAPVTGWGSERTLIAQQPALFPWLSAEDNVAFGLRMAGMSASHRRLKASEMLERLGLLDYAGLHPHALSGGMQQRVALARALVLDPAVLLMDEPLAALDPPLRARLRDEIRTACAERTVLFVTHDVDEALAIADRAVVLTARPGRLAGTLDLRDRDSAARQIARWLCPAGDGLPAASPAVNGSGPGAGGVAPNCRSYRVR